MGWCTSYIGIIGREVVMMHREIGCNALLLTHQEKLMHIILSGLKDNMAHSGPKDMFSACTCACYNFMHVDLKLNMWSNRLFRCGSIFFSISRTDHLSGLYTINSLHED